MARHDLRRVRTFIAIDLAAGVKHRAQEIIKKLKPLNAQVNWAPPEEMHVTLKFLGDIHRDELVPLCKLTREIAAQFEPFDLGFSGLGAFPHADEPRTVWIGIEEGQEKLAALHAALDEALSKQLGFARERRKFTPHLTIGRVQRHTPELITALDALANFESDFTDVDELLVMASLPQRDGPRYELLGHAALGPIDHRAPEEDDEEDVDDETIPSRTKPGRSPRSHKSAAPGKPVRSRPPQAEEFEPETGLDALADFDEFDDDDFANLTDAEIAALENEIENEQANPKPNSARPKKKR